MDTAPGCAKVLAALAVIVVSMLLLQFAADEGVIWPVLGGLLVIGVAVGVLRDR